MQKKANFLTNFLTSTWHNFSFRVKIHSTTQHSTAQHSTAQHSTALVLRFSGKLAKQVQLATSTSYNSARNIISGYMHLKSNITTFSHRKTAHDAGKIMSCTWAFIFYNMPFYVERFWHHSFSSHFYNLAKGDASWKKWQNGLRLFLLQWWNG